LGVYGFISDKKVVGVFVAFFVRPSITSLLLTPLLNYTSKAGVRYKLYDKIYSDLNILTGDYAIIFNDYVVYMTAFLLLQYI
jgi:hypothetical protein